MRSGSTFRARAEKYDAAAVRRWAWSRGLEVSRTGGLPGFLYELYEAHLADGGTPDPPRAP